MTTKAKTLKYLEAGAAGAFMALATAMPAFAYEQAPIIKRSG